MKIATAIALAGLTLIGACGNNGGDTPAATAPARLTTTTPPTTTTTVPPTTTVHATRSWSQGLLREHHNTRLEGETQ